MNQTSKTSPLSKDLPIADQEKKRQENNTRQEHFKVLSEIAFLEKSGTLLMKEGDPKSDTNLASIAHIQAMVRDKRLQASFLSRKAAELAVVRETSHAEWNAVQDRKIENACHACQQAKHESRRSNPFAVIHYLN